MFPSPRSHTLTCSLVHSSSRLRRHFPHSLLSLAPSTSVPLFKYRFSTVFHEAQRVISPACTCFLFFLHLSLLILRALLTPLLLPFSPSWDLSITRSFSHHQHRHCYFSLLTSPLSPYFPPPLVRVRKSAPSRPSSKWWRRIQMITTRARRPTFTTNRQRGNAGSPTLNHTTITRAGPSASLGDDPILLLSIWRSPTAPPPAPSSAIYHTSAPTYTQTDSILDSIQILHKLCGSKRFLKSFRLLFKTLLGLITSTTDGRRLKVL